MLASLESGPAKGTTADDGTLALTGQLQNGLAIGEVTWRLTSRAPGLLAGTHSQLWWTPVASGQVVVAAALASIEP